MNKAIKSVALTSILALGLMSGNVMAQTSSYATAPQQMYGSMMQGQGMMGGKGMMMQGNMGCMKMMGQGMGCGMMGGGMMKNMSAENQQKFMDVTRELRREMHDLHFEHMEAMRNPKSSLEDLADLEEKMLDLRKEIMQKAETFQN